MRVLCIMARLKVAIMLHIPGEIEINGIISRIRMLKGRRLIVLNKLILMLYSIEGSSIRRKNNKILRKLMRTIKIRNNSLILTLKKLK